MEAVEAMLPLVAPDGATWGRRFIDGFSVRTDENLYYLTVIDASVRVSIMDESEDTPFEVWSNPFELCDPEVISKIKDYLFKHSGPLYG